MDPKARRNAWRRAWRSQSFPIVEEFLSREQLYLLSIRRGVERRMARRRRVLALLAMTAAVSWFSTMWPSGSMPLDLSAALGTGTTFAVSSMPDG